MRGNRLAALIAIIVVVAGVWVYFTRFNPVTNYIPEGLDLKGGLMVVLQAKGPVTSQQMVQAEAIMARRANIFGVSEPAISLQGNNEIIVELPGIKDPEAAIKTIGETAQLLFKSPSGKVILTGSDLTNAQAAIQGTGYVIDLTLNAAGTAKFAAATQKYLGKPIGIYLDNHLLTNPVVQSVISQGNAQITGYTSLKAAQQQAELLNGGALPVPMRIIEVRTVSATLGAQSVRASELAGLGAMALIVLFMIIFYRFAGFLADVALAVYLMLLLGVLIAFHAVLTLPGVAGIILSAGIAVDANVIIFARLRDELRAGHPLGTAIDRGFRNAFRAIADSNVSTIVAAIVLYYFGTGEIKGFALTLAIGVGISFITAVGVTRGLLKLAEDTTLVRNVRLFLGGLGGEA